MRNLARVARSGLRFDALVTHGICRTWIEAIQPVSDLVVIIDHLATLDYSHLDETWIRDCGSGQT
jgi:predicted TIM-barrel fold metal-dependent hydrolase